jgi:hypothetical protein
MSKGKSRTASAGGRTATENTGIEYRAWLGTVSEGERIRIAGLLTDYKIESYTDMGGFIQCIMVEVIKGNVTPAVSKELRYWAELLFTVLSIEHTAAGRPEDASGDIITALLAVARVPMPQAHYVQHERAIIEGKERPQGLDVLDAMENVG